VSTTNSLDLYSLLPAIYRIRDAERGYPLRGVLGLISDQAQLVKADIDGLWDDLFIETCADWVVPYIGDLVANNPISEEIARTRADVAHTIYYRRRKGTLTMLEQLARDVTGWDAHAVAFFEELGWSQNLNHLRMHEDVFSDVLSWAGNAVFSVGQVIIDTNGNMQQVTTAGVSGGAPPLWNTTPDGVTPDGTVMWTLRGHIDPFAVDRVGTVLLRDLDALDRLNGPFDTTTHTVDVRPPSQFTGWYNIQNVGFFLWRLQSFFTQEVAPRQSPTYADGFYFSPLGNPAPLFVNPAPAPQGTQLVQETQVQSPIRKVAFYFHPGDYYMNAALGTPSFAIFHGATANPANLIPLTNIVCGDLSNWTPPAPGNVAVDVELGRFAFAPGETPGDGVTVSYTYGFSGPMGGGPYDRRQKKQAATSPTDPGPAIPDTINNPNALGTLIRVPSPGINTISQAVAQWNPAVTPQAVIQIEDNRTYSENVTIPFPVAPPPPGQLSPLLVIQADNLQRPTLLGNITVTGGTGVEELVINGILISGSLHVQANLDTVEIVHCTLVPGIQLDEQGQPMLPESPSILVDPPADSLRLLIDHSITGRLLLPEGMIGLFARDSIIDSPRREAQADFTPVLVSGSLSPFPALSSLTPTVQVTIGDEGPYTAILPMVPTTLAEARDALQTAIQAAHTTTPFQAARVLSASNRLIVVPGADEEVVIEVADSDPTATELKLDPALGRQTSAVVSGVLSPFPAISSLAPQVTVTVGTAGQAVATLAGIPATIAQARDQLQTAIRNAGLPGASAIVTNMDNQLVVVSGDGVAPVTFTGTVMDPTTVVQLKLATERPAIAADDAGDAPGPPATLLRTTIFGEVHVQQLPLASEVIFSSVVRCKRRQDGCVRFSFVPEGSETPKRYRCQPDFEILERTEDAERLAGGPISNADSDAIRDDVRSWLQPLFTDIHYGLPAYGQLSVSCPEQIQTGAEDGSEMGAFCFLKQPQRATSLRVRLQEYLPFGLEPGLIYVT
jgi:hypothetical protein